MWLKNVVVKDPMKLPTQKQSIDRVGAIEI